MVDLEKAKEEFNNYVQKYDLKQEKLARKVDHSYRVMELSTKVAQSQNLTEEGIELATLIGLLHDIARFEQYTKYQTFRDVDSIDHGDYGVQILQENKFLSKFIETRDYDNIILKAIKNHNKFEIEPNLTQEEEIFCKIIRDADKLDIYYEASKLFWHDTKKLVESSKITPYVEEEFYKRNTIKRQKGIGLTQLDKLVSTISFIYDLNFRISFKILKEKGYVNQIIDQFHFNNEEVMKKIEDIRQIANQYIEINL